MHVDIVGLLGMEVVNGIVFAEITAAVRRSYITQCLAQDVWEAWCGSGQERMAYEMDE